MDPGIGYYRSVTDSEIDAKRLMALQEAIRSQRKSSNNGG